MNPIKSPQEMIYEEAGLPHYAPGGSVLSAGASQLFKNLSKKLSSVLGRAPTAQELQQLEQEVAALAKPTSTMEGANLARVAKQEPHANMFANTEGRVFPPTAEGKMPTPGQRQYQGFEQAFDPRDEFVTQMNTGRGNRGTWLHASPEANLADEATLLGQMDTGTELGGHPHQSVTPANDYIAQLADAMQASGVQHDYTGMGPAVYGNRPSFGAGTLTKQQKAELEAWREQARAAGVPEHAITAPPAKLGTNYKYLEEERNLGPAGPEALMGGYASGGTVEEGVETMGFLPRLKGAAGKYFGHALNAGLGALTIPEIKRAIQASQYGKAAGQSSDLAAAFLPLSAYGIYEGGKKASEIATNNLANRPEFSRQMRDVASTDMGGALSGDYALANAILNARNKE